MPQEPVNYQRNGNATPATLSSAGTDTNRVIIRFPCMPEVVEIARDARYTVKGGPPFPDGSVHIYDETAPLRVPINFKLHADDDYCAKGSLTLLLIAAQLHALQLPKQAGKALPTSSATVSDNKLSEALQGLAQRSGLSTNGGLAAANLLANWASPTPCVLDLIGTAEGVGVKMQGYVESVSVRLRGPWRQATDATAYNLPSAAEYYFRFVNAPFYRNSLGSQNPSALGELLGADPASGGQAYAERVLKNLYNIQSLAALQDKTILPDPLLNSSVSNSFLTTSPGTLT